MDFKKLIEDTKADKELAEKFKAATERIGKENASLSKNEVFVKAAAELGYTVNLAELERAEAQKKELSDEEIDSVAGGGLIPCGKVMDATCNLFIPDCGPIADYF